MKKTRIKTTARLLDRMLKEPLYFIDDFEECVCRTEPPNDKNENVAYFIKFKGQLEFLTGKENDIMYNAVHIESISITEKDYNEY